MKCSGAGEEVMVKVMLSSRALEACKGAEAVMGAGGGGAHTPSCWGDLSVGFCNPPMFLVDVGGRVNPASLCPWWDTWRLLLEMILRGAK